MEKDLLLRVRREEMAEFTDIHFSFKIIEIE